MVVACQVPMGKPDAASRPLMCSTLKAGVPLPCSRRELGTGATSCVPGSLHERMGGAGDGQNPKTDRPFPFMFLVWLPVAPCVRDSQLSPRVFKKGAWCQSAPASSFSDRRQHLRLRLWLQPCS